MTVPSMYTFHEVTCVCAVMFVGFDEGCAGGTASTPCRSAGQMMTTSSATSTSLMVGVCPPVTAARIWERMACTLSRSR